MIKTSAEVKQALDQGKAVVALESTIIAHGMPFPQNLETARNIEEVIRQNGATPATIAVVKGELRAGLEDAELQNFARSGPAVAKASIRDLAYAVAKGMDAATTVASTMRLAAMAGIHVFATGGIGGVHRGAESTFDVSNDLDEFSISNVAVVTAGAKAILDLALTLEVLETRGVPVVGFGTDELPAFYSRSSGHRLQMRLDQPDDLARLMHAKWDMGLKGGVVVANPIPHEAEIPAKEIAPFIDQALQEAAKRGISGKETTPFLLARLADITAGRSLAANIALAMNNAKVASQIAVAYAALRLRK